MPGEQLGLTNPLGSTVALVFSCFPGSSGGKESACNASDPGRSLGWGDPLEKGMATQSSTFAGRIPWTEKPGGLQSMGSPGGHD